jgi:hypothetical protein
MCSAPMPGVLPTDDFERLSDMIGDALLRLTCWVLDQVPISPLPAEYQAEWDTHHQTGRTRVITVDGAWRGGRGVWSMSFPRGARR